MKSIVINLYTIAELSDKAKAKAHENYMESDTSFDSLSEIIDTLKNALSSHGFKLKNWNIDYSSAARSTVDIVTEHSEKISALKGIRLWKYLQNNFQIYLNPLRLNARGKHLEVIDTLNSCPFTGVCWDEDFLDPIRKFIEKPDFHTEFYSLMQDCVESVLQAMQKEYEYTQSMEYFTEYAEANELLFTEDGEKYRIKESMTVLTNGFDNWYETYFEIVAQLSNKEEIYFDTLYFKTRESLGITGVYELAKDLTNEFESMYSDKDWDDKEYRDTIFTFLNSKL